MSSSARPCSRGCSSLAPPRLRPLALAVALASACGSGVDFPQGGSEWPARPALPYASKPRFAITVNLSDSLAFVDADARTATLLGSIPVGDVPVELEGPHHVATDPEGRFIYYNLSNYVPGTGGGPHGGHGTGTVPGSLVKLDAKTGAALGEVLVDRSPGEVITSPDGKVAYVTHFDLLKVTRGGATPESLYGTLAVVDVETMRRTALAPICVTPHGAALSADGRTLYVSCSMGDELVTLDVSTPSAPSVVDRVKVGPAPGTFDAPAYFPYAVSVSPKDGTVWISNSNSADVRVYDPAARRMVPEKIYPVGGPAYFGAFPPDGGSYWVPVWGLDQLAQIDTATGTVTMHPLAAGACRSAHALVLVPDGKSGVLVCEGNHVDVQGTAVTLTLAPFAVTGALPIGLYPDGAVYLPGR